MWFCTYQLHYNSSNLNTTQDICKFNNKMSNGNGLQWLTCWAASFWNLLGLQACLQFGQSPCNPVKNVTYLYLLASMHWVYTSPLFSCMWFKNARFNIPNTTKFTTFGTFNFTDISLFRDGNNPGKPYCTTLLSFAPAYLGYYRYIHNHICVLACNDPLLYRSR